MTSPQRRLEKNPTVAEQTVEYQNLCIKFVAKIIINSHVKQ